MRGAEATANGGLIAEMWANTNKEGRQASDWAELGELDGCRATDLVQPDSTRATSKESSKAAQRVGAYRREEPARGFSLSPSLLT